MSGLASLARASGLVDENGTVSGGVVAQISVTASVDASGYENISQLDPTLFLGRVFGVLFRSPACGCRFGSGPGLVLPLALFRFGGFQLKEDKGTDPKTGSDL